MINKNVTWSIYDIESESLSDSGYMVDMIVDMIRSNKDISESNIKIVTIEAYRGTTMEEKAEGIRDICDRYKDGNYVICTTTWLSAREFGDEKALKRESKMLESLGFTDISELVQCQTNISRAYIYPNALGEIVCARKTG